VFANDVRKVVLTRYVVVRCETRRYCFPHFVER
jgi:hypothetical protein